MDIVRQCVLFLLVGHGKSLPGNVVSAAVGDNTAGALLPEGNGLGPWWLYTLGCSFCVRAS